MKKTILLTVSLLSLMSIAHAYEDGPKRAPGMIMEDLTDIKFEYDAKSDLFKDSQEASEYQALFEKHKSSKDITDLFAKTMDEKIKFKKPPEVAKMKEEREAQKVTLLKEIKNILDKKKKDSNASVALNEDVKCIGGKSLPVIEAVTTASMKDSSKVAKIILTEDELAKIKKDIKEEVKKEMMKEMADNKPKGEPRGERPAKRDDRDDEEERPKMADGRGKRQMPGGRGGDRGGNESQSFSFASQMANQMNAQMGGAQMMGSSQMNRNQMGSNQMMNVNQMGTQMRDHQMIQNQIRVPQMNFNQPYQNHMMGNQVGSSQMMNQNQMRRPLMMNQNQSQNQGYQSYAYQSNPGQNYGGVNTQSNYNFMAPQVDYGYTGNSSMMPNVYSGQNNYQYQQQATPSYSQYSFTGF